jgi:hypothetical protein
MISRLRSSTSTKVPRSKDWVRNSPMPLDETFCTKDKRSRVFDPV